MKLWSLAVLAAAALLCIVGASYWSVPAVAVTAGLAAAAAGVGWPHLLGIPARKSQGSVLGLVGAGAVAAAYFAPPEDLLAWLPAAVAVGVGAVFLIQLLRGTGQAKRLESIIGMVAGVLIIATGSGWVAADRLAGEQGSPALLTVGGAAALAALAVCLIPLPDRMAAPLGVVAGALGAGLASLAVAGMPLIASVVSGAVAAALLMAVRRLVLSRDGAASGWGWAALGLAPVLVLGAVLYFLGLAVLR